MKTNLSRRVFLDRLGAGALGVANCLRPAAYGAGGAYAPPPTVTNPNILIILVDQMRQPQWLSPGQMTLLDQTCLPHIFGRIRDKAYIFQQYYTAATACTPSRATLLTGLYAPQTSMYATETTQSAPALNPAFPNWGRALQALNPTYRNNVWWFGKWHLSDFAGGPSTPLKPYGFKTSSFPGGPLGNPSPGGFPNEGMNGGLALSGPYLGKIFGSDAMIASDFTNWLQNQPPAPWCATVSLINPHDIAFAPAWLQLFPFPPLNISGPPVFFPPLPSFLPPLLTSLPNPWNYENLRNLTTKPAAQYGFQQTKNASCGPVTDWITFLNQYYWLQSLVDQQVGRVLDAVERSLFANNTIVIFASDHGEYGGSHGLHDKGSAVYDESLRVPLYVRFPGQTSATIMHQMCSSVDFFGLISDLGTGGRALWAQAYPDLAGRQSIWNFLYQNSPETRIAPAPVGIPYILHTYDETKPSEAGGQPVAGKSHIVSLRTRHDPASGINGAKLAFYSQWAPCTTNPDSTGPEGEFYDYNPHTVANRAELGNDFYSINPATQSTLAQYMQVLGLPESPATGLIATELNAPLIGTSPDGKPLSQAQATARLTYLTYTNGAGKCTA